MHFLLSFSYSKVSSSFYKMISISIGWTTFHETIPQISVSCFLISASNSMNQFKNFLLGVVHVLLVPKWDKVLRTWSNIYFLPLKVVFLQNDRKDISDEGQNEQYWFLKKFFLIKTLQLEKLVHATKTSSAEKCDMWSSISNFKPKLWNYLLIFIHPRLSRLLPPCQIVFTDNCLLSSFHNRSPSDRTQQELQFCMINLDHRKFFS